MMLLSLFLLLAAVWLLLKYVYSYWDRKGFRSIKPTIPYGNLGAAAKREKSFGNTICELYQSSTQPFVGIYLFFRPALLIRDAKLAKNLLTKDFNSFHDRGVSTDERNPMMGNLFNLSGNKWRSLRAKLTPTFTSGKLKNMFVTIKGTGQSMVDYLEEIVTEKGSIVELKDLYSKYAIDIIASVIFGMEINCFTDPDNDFMRISKKFNNKGFWENLSLLAMFLCPKLSYVLPVTESQKEIEKFMIAVVKKTIEFREQNNVSRKDFMQLLLQLRNTGTVGSDNNWDVETVAENLKSMSIEQCAAQVFIFFIAGFESTASATSFCIYELAQDPDKMAKAKEDIRQALEKHNGQLTYDCIQDMKYVDLCLLETFRKYPGLPILNRVCTETYPVPDSDHIIENGTPIVISLMGIHRDPHYFPNPLKFEPERFAENTKNYDEGAYFPFGDGPRTCIAMRLGKLNTKVGIVMLLSKFNVEAIEKKEIEFDSYSVSLIAKGGVNVKISKM